MISPVDLPKEKICMNSPCKNSVSPSSFVLQLLRSAHLSAAVHDLVGLEVAHTGGSTLTLGAHLDRGGSGLGRVAGSDFNGFVLLAVILQEDLDLHVNTNDFETGLSGGLNSGARETLAFHRWVGDTRTEDLVIGQVHLASRSLRLLQ